MSPTKVDAKQSLLLSYTHLNWRGPPLVKSDLASISIHLIPTYYLRFRLLMLAGPRLVNPAIPKQFWMRRYDTIIR